VHGTLGCVDALVLQGEDAPLVTSNADSSSSSSSGGVKGVSKRTKTPKATLPRSLNWGNTTLEDALQLLALPRTVSMAASQLDGIVLTHPPKKTTHTLLVADHVKHSTTGQHRPS
jgi:hypothetical protein